MTAEHSQDLMLSPLCDENTQHAWPYNRPVMNCTQCCVAYAAHAGLGTYKILQEAAHTCICCNDTFAIEAMISSSHSCEDQQADLVIEPLANELCNRSMKIELVAQLF